MPPPSTLAWVEVTPENVDDFHFHGDDAHFPLSAAIAVPNDAKSRAILLARHGSSRTVELVDPLEVVRELMQVVLKVKRLLDINSVLVTFATLLLVGLIVLLSARLRADERRTLVNIGCDPATLFWIQAVELLLLLLVSLALVAALSAALWRGLDLVFR
jgi:putative ABC transport system permease protein